jgi:16S rRNA processing protein RimM
MVAVAGDPIVVARVRKPHGLKGELAIYPLTDDPVAVFTAGRTLHVVTLAGEVVGAVRVEAARGYHREWLLRLHDHATREAVEGYREHFLAVDRSVLPPLEDGEVYQQELVGYAVRDEAGEALGLVTAVYELPAGVTIEVQGAKREFLLPFRGEYVLETDTAGRRLVVRVPDGLLD